MRLDGFVDQCSPFHVAGWAVDLDDPSRPVEVEIWARSLWSYRHVATVPACEFREDLAALGVGTGAHSFYHQLETPLRRGSFADFRLTVANTGFALHKSPQLKTRFEPISYVAADLTSNCNLRCPFCIFDYSDVRRTSLMSEATFDRLLRLLPFVSTEGGFWLSCVHEPTLHPALLDFIDRIPAPYRGKVIFTTNLARKLPEDFFLRLAASGLQHVNVSLDTLDPDLLPRLRPGARLPFYVANLERLAAAFRADARAPKLRFITMAYKSNLAEIEGLVARGAVDYGAAEHEVRPTIDVPHIAAAFRAAEFLDEDDWDWLEGRLGALPYNHRLMRPRPSNHQPLRPAAACTFAPRPLQVTAGWDGRLQVVGPPDDGGGPAPKLYAETNIHHIRHPERFLLQV